MLGLYLRKDYHAVKLGSGIHFMLLVSTSALHAASAADDIVLSCSTSHSLCPRPTSLTAAILAANNSISMFCQFAIYLRVRGCPLTSLLCQITPEHLTFLCYNACI